MQEKQRKLDHVLEPEKQHEVVAIARALCPFAEAASDMLMLICVAMVEAGGDIECVAEEIGINKGRLRQHLQSRLSEQIMQKLMRHRVQGEGYLIAVSSLMEVAGSKAYAGAARNNASKQLISMAEAENAKGGGNGDDGKDLNNMTLKELEAFVGAIKGELKGLGLSDGVEGIEHQGN